MASSWGASWGTSWLNSWTPSGVTPPPDNTAGQTILTKGAGSGRAFTRKRFDEFMAAERALTALEAKAKEVTGRRRVVIQAAAKASADALHAIEEQEKAARVSEIIALTNAMNAARTAKALTTTIKLARAAENYAQQMMDDEDEAVNMLLLQ